MSFDFSWKHTQYGHGPCSTSQICCLGYQTFTLRLCQHTRLGYFFGGWSFSLETKREFLVAAPSAPPSPAYSLEEILQAMLRHHWPKPASLCLNQTKSPRSFLNESIYLVTEEGWTGWIWNSSIISRVKKQGDKGKPKLISRMEWSPKNMQLASKLLLEFWERKIDSSRPDCVTTLVIEGEWSGMMTCNGWTGNPSTKSTCS